MTNSHNRTMGGRNSERNNTNSQQNTGSYYGSNGGSSNCTSSSRKIKGQKSPNNNKFFTSSISPTNSLSSSPPKFYQHQHGRPNNAAVAAHSVHFNNNYHNHHQYNNNSSNSTGNSNNITNSSVSNVSIITRSQIMPGDSSPGGFNMLTLLPSVTQATITSSSTTQLASSPPNITLFAGSKCYDAPSPTALPRPPRHWTLCSVAMTKRLTGNKFTPGGSNRDFADNLKLLLNVRA